MIGLPEKRAGRRAAVPGSDPPSDEFLFHALMESTADSIYFKDRECRLLRVSRKMAESLGFSEQRISLARRTSIYLERRSAGGPGSTTSGSWRRTDRSSG